jgi:hypothetical protein
MAANACVVVVADDERLFAVQPVEQALALAGDHPAASNPVAQRSV